MGDEPVGVTPAAPGHRPRAARLQPAVVLSAGLLALAAGAWSLPLTRQPPAGALPWIPWWSMALLVTACELVVVHLQIRREAQAVSLSELAIVVGLFLCSPADFLAGRALGSVLAFVGWRRQAGIKVLFNWCLYLAETCLALLVFHLLTRDGHADPRGWLAAGAATAAVGVLAGAAVTGVVGLVDGEVRPRDLLTEPARAALASIAVTVPALVAVLALERDRHAAALLLVTLAMLLLGYRAYGALSERHLTLSRLYQFTRVVDGAQDGDEVMRRVLEQACETLHAEYAEVTFAPTDDTDRRPLRVRLDATRALRRDRLPERLARDPIWRESLAGRPLRVPRGCREPAGRSFLTARGLREAVIAPLLMDAEIVGTLLAGNRLGEVRGFDDEDARLLATVANHAGIALQNGRLIDRLRHEALHDGLTGLPNRTLLDRRLAELSAEVRAGRLEGLTVVVLDLVGFKEINDTLGHRLGDQVLRRAAERLRDAAGPGDVIARVGGDEFAALLPGRPTSDEALRAARGLRAALANPLQVDGVSVEVGASVGVCVAPTQGDTAGTLLSRADVAMSEAKSTGTGLLVYEPGLGPTASPHRLALAGELRRGIASGQLTVHVQPLGSTATGAVVGAEALVRWAHPRHGLLQPNDFVHLAERTGLIGPLTTAVLAEAIAACGRWRRGGHRLSVAVNLSAREILDAELAESIAELLDRHGLPPGALTLEITESSIVGRPARALTVLTHLRQLGVRFALDDFGTGYSPLSHLRELPVQELKIDRSFVSRMCREQRDAAIVRSIIDLADNLDLEVVAEGVEDRATWDRLADLGCDLVQGFYLAPPMPLAEFPAWLDRAGGGSDPARPGSPAGEQSLAEGEAVE